VVDATGAEHDSRLEQRQVGRVEEVDLAGFGLDVGLLEGLQHLALVPCASGDLHLDRPDRGVDLELRACRLVCQDERMMPGSRSPVSPRVAFAKHP
jgi:hypothetical protein